MKLINKDTESLKSNILSKYLILFVVFEFLLDADTIVVCIGIDAENEYIDLIFHKAFVRMDHYSNFFDETNWLIYAQNLIDEEIDVSCH